MTASATIRIAYANDRHSSGSLLLKQEEWGKLGRTTMLDLVKALEAQVLGGGSAPLIDCGINADGGVTSYSCAVYAYPVPADLAFNIGITNGTISGPIVQPITVRETVSFSLSDSETLSLPVNEDSDVTLQWNSAELWNEYGEAIQPPTISHAGGTIVAGQRVYGDAIATYHSFRQVYTVTVPAREDSIENVFSSTVYAWWDGGIELLTLSAPPNAEDNYRENTNCFGGSDLIINDTTDDPTRPPTVPSGGEKVISLNYCEDFGHE